MRREKPTKFIHPSQIMCAWMRRGTCMLNYSQLTSVKGLCPPIHSQTPKIQRNSHLGHADFFLWAGKAVLGAMVQEIHCGSVKNFACLCLKGFRGRNAGERGENTGRNAAENHQSTQKNLPLQFVVGFGTNSRSTAGSRALRFPRKEEPETETQVILF